MFRTNPELDKTGGHIYDWLFRNFYTEHLVCIRKEMEKGAGHLTLMNFLMELEQHCESVLTRKRYVALYADSVMKKHGIADEHFDKKVGSTLKNPPKRSDDDYISAASVKNARETLEKENEKVVKYANWFVMHRTRAKAIKVTEADMYAAVDRIFDSYAIYYNLITASTWAERYPTPQFNWHAPFFSGWITKDFKKWEPPK
jgi:hypothetical protein